MKLELTALNGCKLELNVDKTRPNLRIGEFSIDGVFHPWNGEWTNLIFKKFEEPYEVIKARIKKFYEEENLSDRADGHAIRKPGVGLMADQEEEWTLTGAKVIGCNCDNTTQSVILEIAFNGVNYKKNE